MEKEKCRMCNKETKYMYKMNEGSYCETHWQYGLDFQKMNLQHQERMESILLGLNSFRS